MIRVVRDFFRSQSSPKLCWSRQTLNRVPHCLGLNSVALRRDPMRHRTTCLRQCKHEETLPVLGHRMRRGVENKWPDIKPLASNRRFSVSRIAVFSPFPSSGTFSTRMNRVVRDGDETSAR